MSTEEMTARGPGADAAFSLRGVTRRFGDVVAVDDLWLDIEEGEFFSLLGPSGCGKTTTLRMLAGFEEPDEGTILLRGDDVTFTPPNRRNVNLVFQHYELFPHMTVFENVAYGLKLRKVREPELDERVREALAIVRVADLSERGARQLSGGQQQRVALARAIVNRPAVLLLDEPLSALDVKLRKQMQLELKGIQAQLGTTFVYVTHDQEEALLMSDRIGVMVGGRLLQVAPPREIYDHPSDDFVADFIGSLNVLTGTLEALDGGVGRARAIAVDAAAAPGRLAFAAPGPAGPGVGEEIHIAVRPERIELLPADAALAEMTNDTWLPGRIEQIDYLGSLTRVMVSSPGQADVVCQRTSDGSTDKFRAGTSVVMSWPPDAAFVLPGQADTTTSDDRA